jgi:magnesium-transporting ATPase (P-type)
MAKSAGSACSGTIAPSSSENEEMTDRDYARRHLRFGWWSLLFFTMLGLIPWTVGFTFLGYELGEQWHTVEKFIQPIAILVALALLIALAWWIRRRLQERRKAGPGAD